MISTTNESEIVVKVGNKSYKLSSSKEYAEFLIWVTSPDPAIDISPDQFEVDPSVPDQDRPKAERYSEFLKGFAARRKEKLSTVDDGLTAEEREARIKEFINELKGTQE